MHYSFCGDDCAVRVEKKIQSQLTTINDNLVRWVGWEGGGNIVRGQWWGCKECKCILRILVTNDNIWYMYMECVKKCERMVKMYGILGNIEENIWRYGKYERRREKGGIMGNMRELENIGCYEKH